MTVSLFLSDVVGTITLPDGVTVHAHEVGWVRSVGGDGNWHVQLHDQVLGRYHAVAGFDTEAEADACAHIVIHAVERALTGEHMTINNNLPSSLTGTEGTLGLWYREAHLPDAERDAEHAARRFVAACKTAMTGRAVTVDEDLRTVSMDPPAYADNDRKVDR